MQPLYIICVALIQWWFIC